MPNPDHEVMPFAPQLFRSLSLSRTQVNAMKTEYRFVAASTAVALAMASAGALILSRQFLSGNPVHAHRVIPKLVFNPNLAICFVASHHDFMRTVLPSIDL